MNLKDYLDEMGIPVRAFARRLEVSNNTVHAIFKGQDIRLSIALKIEKLTKGAVKCKVLEPLPKETKKGSRKNSK
jgi:predicted transcriptional regulator